MKKSRSSKHKAKRFGATYFLYVGLIILCIVGMAAVRLNVVKMSYKVVEAKLTKKKLKKEILKTKLQKSALLAPNRIERLAKEEFGLHKAKPKQIITVSK